MTISLSDAGKRFNRDWIFRHFSYQFQSGTSYAITGPNGSGKSTLLQAISGSLMLTEGKILYATGNDQIPAESIYRQVSIAAPYLELVEEMTITELLGFHMVFKPLISGITKDDIIKRVGLEKASNKQIRYYSSGMKQRAKLAQCFFSNSPIILLDEPCTNLDQEGIELYHRLVEEYTRERLVIVSSNDETEYRFCKNRIQVTDFK